MSVINFKLKGLTCEACVKLCAKRIKTLPGVQTVEIDLATGAAQVSGASELDLETIKQSLVDIKYEVLN